MSMPILLTPEEQQTIDWYNNNAREWADTPFIHDIHSTEVERFHKTKPTGKLLEIGCGQGRDAHELIALGYDYTGTDASQALLDIAAKNNPGHPFLLQDLYNLDFPDNSFDAFWCYATLLHVPKARLTEALESIHRVIWSGGRGYISLKEGQGESVDEKGRYFSYYSEGEFARLLELNGYNVLKHYSYPVTEKRTWLAFHVEVQK